MKNYKTLLKKYEGVNVVFIHHEWGQNAISLYNQVVKMWNSIDIGSKIVIRSYKQLGIKSAVQFLRKRGLNPTIVGKGAGNLRLVELEKDIDKYFERIDTKEIISFTFNNREYQVNVGDAIFSKAGLDKGTRFLLETFLDTKINLNHRKVADLGSGWGAISLILANEFPEIRITAYEKDDASFEMSRINLRTHPNVKIVKEDLARRRAKKIEEDRRTFAYIISNPPFHSAKEERTLIFENANKLLEPRGEMFFVSEGNFVDRFRKTAKDYFSVLEETTSDRYVVFRCKNKRRNVLLL